MEHFSGAGQLVTLGLVDSSIGAVSKLLALVDVEASIAKELTGSNLSCHAFFFSNNRSSDTDVDSWGEPERAPH